jgi:hypothetical protein
VIIVIASILFLDEHVQPLTWWCGADHRRHPVDRAGRAAGMTGASAADLAVVIVNYNTGDWLRRCLASIDAARGRHHDGGQW